MAYIRRRVPWFDNQAKAEVFHAAEVPGATDYFSRISRLFGAQYAKGPADARPEDARKEPSRTKMIRNKEIDSRLAFEGDVRGA